MDIVNYHKEGKLIDLYAEALQDEKVLFRGNIQCSFCYDAGYEQESIDILWNVKDEVMHSLGLHGSYNTNFQTMYIRGISLIIDCVTDNIIIIISKVKNEFFSSKTRTD